MNKNTSSPWSERHFTADLTINFCEVRGNSEKGYWLFEAYGSERVGGEEKKVEFSIHFMPLLIRYTRVFSLTPTGSDSIISTEVANLFEAQVRVAAKINNKHIRHKPGSDRAPSALLQNLGKMLAMHGYDPEQSLVDELCGRIHAYLNTPQHKGLVGRCKTETPDYFFGDSQIGKFFVKERPPSTR